MLASTSAGARTWALRVRKHHVAQLHLSPALQRLRALLRCGRAERSSVNWSTIRQSRALRSTVFGKQARLVRRSAGSTEQASRHALTWLAVSMSGSRSMIVNTRCVAALPFATSAGVRVYVLGRFWVKLQGRQAGCEEAVLTHACWLLHDPPHWGLLPATIASPGLHPARAWEEQLCLRHAHGCQKN